MSEQREPYDDFEIASVEETFTTSSAGLRPGIIELVTPINTVNGKTNLAISGIQPDSNDPDIFTATGRAKLPGTDEQFVVARDLIIPRDANRVTVGDTLIFDPAHEGKGIRSRKLWEGLGVVTVTLAGIEITRRVLRARRKQ